MNVGDLVRIRSQQPEFNDQIALLLEYEDQMLGTKRQCYAKVVLLQDFRILYISPTSLEVIC